MGVDGTTLFFLLLLFRPCFSIDTGLSKGQSLSAMNMDSITSKNRKFELGFFERGTPRKFYLGIWFKRLSGQRIVWVANRENHLSDPSTSTLKLSDDGNLVLEASSKQPFWSTNFQNLPTNATEAALLDDGNLVLRDRSNLSTIFWESFDHPTDTWLPGGKLGIDKAGKVPKQLISWKNSEDPSPGLYSLRIDPNESRQYILEWNRSQVYWSTGVWNGNSNTFSSVPEMRKNYIFKFSFVSNENETYFTYSLYNASIIAMFSVTSTGQIQQTSWVSTEAADQPWFIFWAQPKSPSQVYALCGPFGLYDDNTSKFCDCLNGFEPFLDNQTKLADWPGGCLRRHPLQCETRNAKSDWFQKIPNISLPIKWKAYSATSAWRCKLACTNNCSCTAYAHNSSGCMIWEGNLLNMKRLSDGGKVGQDIYLRLAADERQIESETKWKVWVIVAVLVAATCLILFLFVCFSKKRKLKRKDPIMKKILDWRTRIQIIEGIAQGLIYLHQYSRLKIIHRDVKPSNILLDNEMNPKISDFGMARIVGDNEIQANTNRIVGTFGYMSPEYAMEGLYSIKSDVFSFGVLLLEIVSGKKNTGFYNHGSLNLLRYAWELWRDGQCLDVMDSTIGYPSSTSILVRYVTIGLLCVQESPADRPTMLDVVSMISNEHAPLPTPKQPAYTAGRNLMHTNSTIGPAKNCSINNVTISVMEAR